MDNVVIRRLQSSLPTLVCVLALPICAIWIHPWVELGIVDDWSYIQTARILANSGHIAYNGWATAMLGWQLYLGAAFIKLFGFSFTAPRLATLAVAMATAALVHRVFVRLGITTWNATAATLVLLLSPPFMAVTFSFMSDVYGMLVSVGCCYCCIRALQSVDEQRATLWLCAAAIGTAVGGTARQISWLGLLVMVPCTIWLLRKNRSLVWKSIIATVSGIAVMIASLLWFNHQPYIISEHLIPSAWPGTSFFIIHTVPYFIRISIGELLLLSMPVLLVLAPALFRSKLNKIVATAWILLSLTTFLYAHKVHGLGKLAAISVPYMFNNLWYSGMEYFPSYIGSQPILLTTGVRLILTLLSLLGGSALFATLWLFIRFRMTQAKKEVPAPLSLNLRTTAMLLLPCTIASLLILVPRMISPGLTDRYFIFPEFILLAFTALLYQHTLGRSFSIVIWGLILAMAIIDTAGLHDAFSLFRAQEKLLNELTSQGVPRTAIDGGSQYNGWTETEVSGHLSDPRMINPRSSVPPLPQISENDPCHTRFLELTPSIHSQYVVSFNPSTCGGASRFAPVVFMTYFGPHVRTLYAVTVPSEIK
jgi:hypothetical protein